MRPDPAVDVVIAVHDLRRRIDRAVDSVLASSDRVRVTVVAHGLSADSVRGALDTIDPRVRVLEYDDGIRSPSGPFNHGLQAATAEFVMIMGSDDFLEGGAIDAWLSAARGSGADIQIAPLRHQGGALLVNPLTRPGHRTRLDPVKDRLFYRTAPLGLLRRDLIGDGSPLTPGMPVGGDLAWSSELWTSGARICFDLRVPAYLIGNDAPSRVTMTPRAADVVFAPVDSLLKSGWAAVQPERIRAALAVKLLRVNVLGALRARPDEAQWPPRIRAGAANTVRLVAGYGGIRSLTNLPRCDRDLLDVAADHSAGPSDLVAAIVRHRRAGTVARLMTRNPLHLFGRESVLRRYARYRLEGDNG